MGALSGPRDRRGELIDLEGLRAALAARRARVLDGRRRAAVAIVLAAGGAEADLLFIERAHRRGDPWSGQMAFPGGRVEPGDPDERAAAERETREELGIDLGAAEPLGRLDDLHAGVRPLASLVLSSFVYRVGERLSLAPNHEVQSALWVPARVLLDPAHHVRHRFGVARFPGILVGEPDRHVVWGLTYRLLRDLFGAVGVTLPGR